MPSGRFSCLKEYETVNGNIKRAFVRALAQSYRLFFALFFEGRWCGKVEANVESGALDAIPSSEARTASDSKPLKPMLFEESIQISAPDTTQTL